jgi:hypothetical protein
MSVEDRIMEKKVRGLISYLADSLTYLKIQKSSENPLEAPLMREAIGAALKVFELCKVRKTAQDKISRCLTLYCCPEYICHRAKGQRAAR